MAVEKYTDNDHQVWLQFGDGTVRPQTQADLDEEARVANEGRQAQIAQYNSAPYMQQFTPEQTQSYLADPRAFTANNPEFLSNKGIYNDNVDGSGTQHLWLGPQPPPMHTDNVWEGIESAYRDMKPGLSIMSLMGAGSAISAGLYGAGGAAATGATAGTAGSDALVGSAGADTLGAGGEGFLYPGESAGGATGGSSAMMPAAHAEDVFGGYNIDPNTGDVYYGTGDNPYSSNYSGGNTNDFFTGAETAPGQTSPGMLQKAQEMAKQLGISPASALGFLKNALTKGAPAILGAVAANQQANSLSALSDKYLEFGAPSRARYEASFAPGFTMMNDPGYKDALDMTTKATLHGLSVNGNPAGSPNAWEQTLSDVNAKLAFPALQNFRNTNANAGGIATLQTAAPGAATGAINAQGNVFNALGAGANDIFNPKPSLAQTLADYKRLLGTAAP